MEALEVKVRRHHVLDEPVKLVSGGEKPTEWNRIIGNLALNHRKEWLVFLNHQGKCIHTCTMLSGQLY
jgi:hypothetical protein